MREGDSDMTGMDGSYMQAEGKGIIRIPFRRGGESHA
jgi:hypothetical protein